MITGLHYISNVRSRPSRVSGIIIATSLLCPFFMQPVAGQSYRTTYSYDADGRLSRVQYVMDPATAWITSYGFDEVGYLTQIKTEAADPTGSETPGLPKRFALHQNAPNPFSSRTVIRFDLPTPSDVKIEIFDLLGRRIRVLLSERGAAAGYRSTEWNGRSDSGAPVASGTYVLRFTSGVIVRVRKMTIVR